MKKLLQKTAFLTIFAIGSATLSAADAPTTPPPGRPPGGPGAGPGGGRAMGGGMNLDEKQRELLREGLQKDQEQLRGLDEKLRAAQKELVHATLAEKFDEKAIREKADALAKVQADLTVLRAKAFSAVAPTLKPEQREQLENSPITAAMLGGRMGMGGMGGMGGGPGYGGGRGENPPGAPGAGGQPGGRRRGGAGNGQ